jgi:3-hydroxybutyryl-CoA dehydrogenase
MSALDSAMPVAVIGAGAMGAGIAQVALMAGHPVRLYDNRAGAAADAVAGIRRQLARLVEKQRLSAADADVMGGRLMAIETLAQLADAGLVVEAIVENLAVKRELLAQLENLCGDHCILASNTSSLSITALAAGSARPQRVVGMHFFNPAPLMALVEVVSGLATDQAVAACIYDTVLAWGKKPVHTRSTPGFIVNRVARPFYAESLRLLQEQAADCATLDALMRDAGGFRMGAFELTDLIGHDVNYAVTCSVFDAYYGDFRFQPSLIQKELVDAGFFGRKSGRGFYDYQDGAQRPPVQVLTADTVVDGEAGACLPECRVPADMGVLEGLVERLCAAGVEVVVDSVLTQGQMYVGEVRVALTDGRLASECSAAAGGQPLVLLDLALDYRQTPRLAISRAAATSDAQVQGLVNLLAIAGIAVSELADIPGLLVMRTVAMLANEAADAVLQGVGSADGVDLAMCAGVNYPRGPLAWAAGLGYASVTTVLQHLQQAYGEDRYRPSLWLRRQALAAQSQLQSEVA